MSKRDWVWVTRDTTDRWDRDPSVVGIYPLIRPKPQPDQDGDFSTNAQGASDSQRPTSACYQAWKRITGITVPRGSVVKVRIKCKVIP